MDSDWFIRIKMDLNRFTLGLVTEDSDWFIRKKGSLD
jgi:hypothetical protein